MSLKYRQMCMRCISAVDIHVVNTLNKYANFIKKNIEYAFPVVADSSVIWCSCILGYFICFTSDFSVY